MCDRCKNLHGGGLVSRRRSHGRGGAKGEITGLVGKYTSPDRERGKMPDFSLPQAAVSCQGFPLAIPVRYQLPGGLGTTAGKGQPPSDAKEHRRAEIDLRPQ